MSDQLFLGEGAADFVAFTEPLIRKRLHPGDRLLDVGCGDARTALKLLKELPLAGIVGVDNRHSATTKARELAGDAHAQFFTGDAQNVAWLAAQGIGKFDVILARNSVHHFQDPVGGLRNYCALLKPGGRLLLIDSDWESVCAGNPLAAVFAATINVIVVISSVGVLRAWQKLRSLQPQGAAWRQHLAEDKVHRERIGWNRYGEIRAKLRAAFPEAEIGRLGSCGGYGGVHYMIHCASAVA